MSFRSVIRVAASRNYAGCKSHSDEGDQIAFARDQIDFADGVAHPAVENAPAFQWQPPPRESGGSCLRSGWMEGGASANSVACELAAQGQTCRGAGRFYLVSTYSFWGGRDMALALTPGDMNTPATASPWSLIGKEKQTLRLIVRDHDANPSRAGGACKSI